MDTNDWFAEVRPEDLGFCPQRLARLDRAMAGVVAEGTFAGMVTALGRRGRMIGIRGHGTLALDSTVPMAGDTIFRVASMTKPVTGVAMMLLHEEGLWRPEDPIRQHIPEFADLMVYAGEDADGTIALEAPCHAPTMGELMTHTAGFSYGFDSARNAVDRLYYEGGLAGGGSRLTGMQDMIDKLAKMPLLYQPGTRWVYSMAVDIQGYIVEKLSGMTIRDFFEQRIFAPLGMIDSAFHVPASKQHRLATAYSGDGKGGLVPMPQSSKPDSDPAYCNPGGGLFMTARDYARFAAMLAGQGAVDGVRLLAPSTVRLMTANHLDDRLVANGEFGLTPAANGYVFPDTMKSTDAFGIAFFRPRPGVGFGYDLGVIHDPFRAGRTIGKGMFHWDGALSTWFWVDPEHETFFVGMVQRIDMANIPNLQDLSRTLVMQALVDEAA